VFYELRDAGTRRSARFGVVIWQVDEKADVTRWFHSPEIEARPECQWPGPVTASCAVAWAPRTADGFSVEIRTEASLLAPRVISARDVRRASRSPVRGLLSVTSSTAVHHFSILPPSAGQILNLANMVLQTDSSQVRPRSRALCVDPRG
jgi:hypothetical protein